VTSGDRDFRFRAALSRFGCSLVAIVLLPIFYPRTRGHLWVWGTYLVIAGVMQVLIKKRVGGEVRALVSGLIDVSIITFTVHCLGSTATPMASLYFFLGVANALVVSRAVGLFLAAFGVVAYDALVWAEHARLLAFAPDVPQLEMLGAPSLDQAVLATVFVSAAVLGASVIVSTLMRELQQRESMLTDLSQRDPLTNLYNRRHLFERMELELLRVKRGTPLAVVMIDLDGFKKVNDALGHLRGDVLLKEIAASLVRNTREVDVAGRYGGDEFVVVLPQTTGEEGSVAAERVALAVREAAQRFDATHSVTASVGLAVATKDDTVASLLRRADENAYRAKQHGGDRVVA
jgi:diguanylate cyclase (GGDEF)-like protein